MQLALVTGGSGFIGSEVIAQLTSNNVRVRALLRKTSPRENLTGLEFTTALGDLTDLESLRAAVKDVDYVFHLAGTVSGKDREDYFLHNAQGTENLARACAEVNPRLKRFVYVSSIAASGPARGRAPLVESDATAPISAYGESKLAGEHALEHWSSKGGYPYTIVRPPAVYGPRDKNILEFIKVVNAGVIPVFPSTTGSAEKFYSLIHVEDLVRGIVLAGLAPEQSKKETFFLSGDGEHAWSDIMGAIAAPLGKKGVRVKLPWLAWRALAFGYSAAGWAFQKQFPFTLDKINELLPDYWVCSNVRAKNVLGFEPRWDLKTGMANTISWYKQNGWM